MADRFAVIFLLHNTFLTWDKIIELIAFNKKKGNLLGFQSKGVSADENVQMMVNKNVKSTGLNAFGFPTSKTFSSTSIFGAGKCTQVTTQTVTSRNALGDIGNKITVSTAGTIVSLNSYPNSHQ